MKSNIINRIDFFIFSFLVFTDLYYCHQTSDIINQLQIYYITNKPLLRLSGMKIQWQVLKKFFSTFFNIKY